MNYYFCDNEKHTHQICTDKDNPICPTCNTIMTFGRFTDELINGTILKPGIHEAIDGTKFQIGKRFVMVY